MSEASDRQQRSIREINALAEQETPHSAVSLLSR